MECTEKSCFVVLLWCSYLLSFPWKKIRGITFGATHIIGVVCDCTFYVYEITLSAEKASVYGGNEIWTNIQKPCMQIILRKKSCQNTGSAGVYLYLTKWEDLYLLKVES